MPLANNNYNWRPNDNSSATSLRYQLEAEKWVEAVGNAKKNTKKYSGPSQGDIGVITMIFELVSYVFILIIMGIARVIQGIVGLITQKNENNKKVLDPSRNRVQFSKTVTKEPVLYKDYSDRFLKPPRKKDYPDADEYREMVGAYTIAEDRRGRRY